MPAHGRIRQTTPGFPSRHRIWSRSFIHHLEDLLEIPTETSARAENRLSRAVQRKRYGGGLGVGCEAILLPTVPLFFELGGAGPRPQQGTLRLCGCQGTPVPLGLQTGRGDLVQSLSVGLLLPPLLTLRQHFSLNLICELLPVILSSQCALGQSPALTPGMSRRLKARLLRRVRCVPHLLVLLLLLRPHLLVELLAVGRRHLLFLLLLHTQSRPMICLILRGDHVAS
mmetsp:Transcript_1799/g.4040  ORF Transcript_1799/g.4040 Transcript_1799/m.4040 type:complete len:227 (-) Transcript_1799:161-841(-)